MSRAVLTSHCVMTKDLRSSSWRPATPKRKDSGVMDNTVPVQKPAHIYRRLARRVSTALLLLFAVSFGISWWLTPIEPYATLNHSECDRFLFSSDSTMLVTQCTAGGPLRVWDVAKGHELF